MAETKYIFKADCGCHVGKIVGGTTYFLHVDHLGSLRQETDINGNTVWASPAMYEPFGELRGGGPANNEEGHLYTGKLRDTSTGLYYYGARYYDAKVGRFITKDSYTFLPDDERLRDMQNEEEKVKRFLSVWIITPNKFNGFVYSNNNPIRHFDPNGHDWWDELSMILATLVLIGTIIAFIVGAASGVGLIIAGAAYVLAVATYDRYETTTIKDPVTGEIIGVITKDTLTGKIVKGSWIKSPTNGKYYICKSVCVDETDFEEAPPGWTPSQDE